MSLKFVKTAGLPDRPHQCCICEKQGKWNKNWAWFGNYKDIDDGKKIDKCCSDKCITEYNRRHRIPKANRLTVDER
jgi:hypothetical protein